jgi:Skp family chaperone for outer membrane proteins
MRLIGIIAASLLLCASTSLPAQTFGPPITGLCLLSRAAAIGGSRAGQSMQAQLKQMQSSLNSDLAQRRAALDQQRRQLETQQGSIPPIDYKRQMDALVQKAQGLEQAQNARFIAAQQRGQQQLDRALGEALAKVITRQACSLVLERDSSYGWNNAMDVTPAVTKEMDTLLQGIVLQG